MQIDIVIPNYCGARLLAQHLPSMMGQGYSIIVVDDASTDDSVEMLRQRFPEVKVIARTTNGGFSKAVNDGIRATSGEFLVLLNNDVEVTPGFVDPIMPLFDDGSVFAVSPRIILPSKGDLDEGCKAGRWHHGMLYIEQRQDVKTVSPIINATGCAAVYRRSMLEELGGFDEAYSPFYWEDADLGYRAWKMGWKSLYQPESMVYHQHAASISRLPTSYVRRVQIRNAFMFLWRNIDSPDLLAEHRRWLPAVLARKCLSRDSAFLRGWRHAFARRRECESARQQDVISRRLSDGEIFRICGVREE